mmetsp:Transcript_25836/g.25111  ORF Transcript_25836/g.25111 Transcript_25836/m.25111 type:complete len:123 (+) Transcript_25836:256-624(+)
MKDRVVRETLEELSIYFGNLGRSLSFPEMIVPVGVVLRKFKKNTTNASYRKVVAHFLDLANANADFIVKKREAVREKSLRNIHGMMMSFESELGKEVTPLEKEKEKIEGKRTEYLMMKIHAA